MTFKPRLTPQSARALADMAQPMRGRVIGIIDRLAGSGGEAPSSDPVPLLFPQRQLFLEDSLGGRWRIVFCTYPDLRILHVPVIERAPIF